MKVLQSLSDILEHECANMVKYWKLNHRISALRRRNRRAWAANGKTMIFFPSDFYGQSDAREALSRLWVLLLGSAVDEKCCSRKRLDWSWCWSNYIDNDSSRKSLRKGRTRRKREMNTSGKQIQGSFIAISKALRKIFLKSNTNIEISQEILQEFNWNEPTRPLTLFKSHKNHIRTPTWFGIRETNLARSSNYTRLKRKCANWHQI